MGMRREQEDRVALADQIDVRDVAPLPREEPAVLLARDGLSDAEAHAAHLPVPGRIVHRGQRNLRTRLSLAAFAPVQKGQALEQVHIFLVL